MFLYNKHTDDELFQLLKDGDAKAFNVIYNRYWKTMFALAEKKLNNGFRCRGSCARYIY
ncbi:MAG: hypothetical protein PW786_11375 [Arachidicoccus sp.]|nr:hypothetical protein [Arachidicoccus sp.]